MSLLQKIKNELAKLSIKPKKGLGQNFLINEGIYKKIVAAAEIKAGDMVVEIGSGLGTLTEYLAQTGANIVAIEKDHKLASYLTTKFARNNHVTIIEDDIIKFNPATFARSSTSSKSVDKYRVVGNIPYYLTSHLLRIIFEAWPSPELIVLMLQKEVAQRIVAKPPKMSLLAVSVQYYAQPKIISYVSHGSFYPQPEVDSAIIRLVPSEQFTVDGENAENCKLKTANFFRVVRAGFAGKRKQLVNNLARELKLTKNFVEKKIKSIGIDPKRRAETLTLGEWEKIVNILLPQD